MAEKVKNGKNTICSGISGYWTHIEESMAIRAPDWNIRGKKVIYATNIRILNKNVNKEFVFFFKADHSQWTP